MLVSILLHFYEFTLAHIRFLNDQWCNPQALVYSIPSSYLQTHPCSACVPAWRACVRASARACVRPCIVVSCFYAVAIRVFNPYSNAGYMLPPPVKPAAPGGCGGGRDGTEPG